MPDGGGTLRRGATLPPTGRRITKLFGCIYVCRKTARCLVSALDLVKIEVACEMEKRTDLTECHPAGTYQYAGGGGVRPYCMSNKVAALIASRVAGLVEWVAG